MPKTARETSVAEVKFVDEPATKRAREDEIDTPAKDVASDKHPLKMIQRGARSNRRRSLLRSIHRDGGRDVSSAAGTEPGAGGRAFPPTRTDSSRTLTRLSLPRARLPSRPHAGKSVLDLCTYKGDFDSGKLDPETRGPEKSLEYRIDFSHKNRKISPWHDIPYRASPDTFHMMCEIPKWTRAKFEIATKEPGNPIKQDEKKGVLREYKHGDMLFNYGFMPQTWEDPAHVSADTGFKGDDDPLDMVEVGCRQMKCGQVAEVKVLGVLAMIDDGETDWKVFCIRTDDPLAGAIHDVDDLERELPGGVSTMREWFREYKLAEGKPLNAFALDERCMDREYTEKVIEETHGFWKKAEEKLRKLAAP